MTSIEHVGKNAPLDLAKLEADVTAAIPACSLMPINGAPSVQSDPMPDYSSIKMASRVSPRSVQRPWCATMNPQPRKLKRWEPN